ncbi:MAG: polysaccharide biosynthesis protein [Elusimicrobia bacterium GWC2_51_8]|nr:MAG: polysaccharide biosynthesis protein [Elusimicrobia bacterium GWA2_51_34]OGR59342.1 MAG: polysaccharide biosynthesis protein [Elusimicrobia bacterium GWC2_51_8]OGR86971.1 MAG: polysaccharide biosynthesis protein [Elusimicrobia bacterium GWF2_52_66]HAF96577.1 polysaccharide biosynthesis protein [Elusimicrobiota bacterium]HCE98197.1 polysaccharide biosynthesis protein [Elusimicrobiota bacterium]
MIFDKKTVLVTGGTGSFGKIFVKRVLSGEQGTPKKLIVLSRDEAKQNDMRVSYMKKTAATDEVIYNNFRNVLEFRIGDVRSYADVCSAIKGADIVINAAALKQVPVCEYFPGQAVLTNCLGPENILRAIRENDYPVETVIGISTDKACKPVNVMGMTKAIQERIFTSANVLNPKTRFICVRYGNVLASRGSVIPLFHEQIKHGGPVTITVPEMTRFLLTLNEAVNTVFAAIKYGKRGETYVPIAMAALVTDIAKALIGDRKIEIKITGIRPSEKLAEIMVSEEEIHHCIKRGDYYVIAPMLPELQEKGVKLDKALTKEYSSDDDLMNFNQTLAMLKKQKLLVGDDDYSVDGELLR